MIYVVHCKQVPNHEYIGRPSPLGNPFVWNKNTPKGSTLPAYRKWLYEQIASGNKAVCDELDRLEALARKGDLYLGCWCAPHPCHGDVIKEVLDARINQPKTNEKVELGMSTRDVLTRFMELGNKQLRGEVLSLDLAEEFNDLLTVINHLNLKSHLPSKFKPFLSGKEETPAQVHAEPESTHPAQRKQVAIIGSRRLTEEQFEYLIKVAEAFARRGYIIRTGGADRADHAAMLGCRNVDPSLLHVYLPWDGYNKTYLEDTDTQIIYDPKEDIEWSQSVYKYHPAPQNLTRGAFALMARNWGILMHDTPVDIVVAYPVSAADTGGTGQGMRIAKDKGIELFTVCEKEERQRLKAFLKGGKKKPTMEPEEIISKFIQHAKRVADGTALADDEEILFGLALAVEGAGLEARIPPDYKQFLLAAPVTTGIKIVKGNLLDHQGIVVHQVNCQGVMGAGIAKQIKEKWPIVFDAYKRVAAPTALGRAQFVQVGESYVVNLFAQANYGRGEVQTDYEAFRKGCKELKKKAKSLGLPIGLPFGIGCGLAGGDWTLVKEILAEELAGLDVTLYKYVAR